MADPLSPLATSVGVADICVRVVRSIRQLQHELRTIDDDLKSLSREVDGLRDICVAVENMFTSGSDDTLRTEPPKKLQVHLATALTNCRSVVLKLNDTLIKIWGHKDAAAPGNLDALGRVMRKKAQEGELRNCRMQLATYQNALQLVLTTITMQNTSLSQDSSARSFADLAHDVHSLDESIQSQIDNLRQSIQSSDGYHYDASALASLRELRETVSFSMSAMKTGSTNHLFDIPQSVSSIFTGREALLRELAGIFSPGVENNREPAQRRFVIHGLAGSGKTQFCCKFAQDNQDSFWSVFWVDASTSERLENTLGSIAEFAGLEKNGKSALHWLSNIEQRWLLIIDNADDENVPVEKCFPKGNRGNILVTTRNPAYKVHGNIGPRFYDFGGLELAEATQLLLKASEQPAPWDVACEALALTISEALGFLALAIIHAGAAIRDKLCGLTDYLDYYGRSWRRIRAASLQARGSASDAASFATWELCYERLERKGTEAAVDALELLRILAFFHSENISPNIFFRALRNTDSDSARDSGVNSEEQSPKSISSWVTSRATLLRETPASFFAFVFKNRGPPALPNIFRDTGRPGAVEDAEDRVRCALKELSRMSLISYNDLSDTYQMHPIVHVWARERPGMSLGDQALWADMAGRVLGASILLPPKGRSAADQTYCISLLSHVEHVQRCRQSTAEAMSRMESHRRPAIAWISDAVPTMAPDADRIRMYAKFSLVYAKSGHWTSAEALLLKVKNFLCKYLGPEHERSRQAALFLSTVYWHLGRALEAAKLQESILKICSARLGPSHPDTLQAMTELGRTRWQQGQYTKAHALQEGVLAQLLLSRPEDDPDVLEAMDNLGLTVQKFWGDRHFEEAFRLHSRAAAGMARAHGADHERTLIAKENSCRVAALLGGRHLEPAAYVMGEVLDTRTARLGKEHPYTLLAMVNMAIVLGARGRFSEAEELIRRGLPAADRNLGRDHIGTLFGRHALACILSQRGRYGEAEALLVDVAERQKSMRSQRGDYHPDRLVALIELARCCYRQGRVRDAIELCDEAIAGFDCIASTPHPLAARLRTARAEMVALDGEMEEEVKKKADKRLETDEPITDIGFPYVLFRPLGD